MCRSRRPERVPVREMRDPGPALGDHDRGHACLSFAARCGCPGKVDLTVGTINELGGNRDPAGVSPRATAPDTPVTSAFTASPPGCPAARGPACVPLSGNAEFSSCPGTRCWSPRTTPARGAALPALRHRGAPARASRDEVTPPPQPAPTVRARARCSSWGPTPRTASPSARPGQPSLPPRDGFGAPRRAPDTDRRGRRVPHRRLSRRERPPGQVACRGARAGSAARHRHPAGSTRRVLGLRRGHRRRRNRPGRTPAMPHCVS